ncbi:hypothetical protein OKW35_002490 [Paraburkholderia sp. MM5477-R1]
MNASSARFALTVAVPRTFLTVVAGVWATGLVTADTQRRTAYADVQPINGKNVSRMEKVTDEQYDGR